MMNRIRILPSRQHDLGGTMGTVVETVGTMWCIRVDGIAGHRVFDADEVEVVGDAPDPPTWVPWPTAPGVWWCRLAERPDEAFPCHVTMTRDGLCVRSLDHAYRAPDAPCDGWSFARAVPPA